MKGTTSLAVLPSLWSTRLSDHIVALAWSPDGRYIAAAAVDGPLQVLDGATGARLLDAPGHHFGTLSLAWSADSRYLASGGQDGNILLWDLAADPRPGVLEGGVMWVEHLAWNPPGTRQAPVPLRLASAAGKTLRLWDSQGQLLREYAEHPSTISALQWQPQTQILTSTAYGRVAFFNPDNPVPQRELRWPGSILSLAWSPNGRFIAAGGQDATVHFWFTKTGDDLQMSGYPTKVRELSWSADSRWLATGGAAAVTIWDCVRSPAGSKPLQLRGHDELLTQLAWQHRGVLLVSAGGDGRLLVWRPRQSSRALAGAKVQTAVTRIAWASDDTRLAVGTATGAVLIVTVPQGSRGGKRA